jgi:serine/threonine protein kinase
MRSKNLSHCDLKPENILYKKDQTKKSGFRFLVADFGNSTIGDFIDYRIQSSHYRCSENLIASIYKNKSLNQITSCDYYSLGCILFEAITSQCLFSDTQNEKIYLYNQLCFSFYDFFVTWSDMPGVSYGQISEVREKDPDFYNFIKNFYEKTFPTLPREMQEEVAEDSFEMFKEKVDPSFHDWFDFIKQLVFPFPNQRLQGEEFFEHNVFQ